MAGTSYTRQSTFADGDTITAALFNDEYNQLVNAFSYASSGTTGHRHDGTSGEGGNIHVIGDEDFLNKIAVDSTNNRWGFYVEVSSAAVEQIRIQDGAIVPVTDDDIDLGTSSLEFKDLYLDGTATIDTLTVDGASTIGTTLGVTGATTLSSTLDVTGAATFDGNVTIGDAATDTLTITADVASNIIPSADSTYTLGDGSNYWSHGYMDAVTTTGDISVGGNLTVTGNATISGNLTFGDAATDTINLAADVASNILPSATNTYDIGGTGAEWKDIYIDGVAYVDSIDLAGTTITATGAELNTLAGITATVSELNTLDGITATVAELNYTDGVTSNIQTQLNNKQALDSDLTTIAGLSNADGNFIVGSATGWVVESGSTARTSLGLGSLATASTISNTDWSGADLEIANGGTGASTASTARTNLGVEIGTDVQAWDAQLDDISGLAVTDGNFIVGNGTNWVAESGNTAIASLGVTATATELNVLDGITATTAELNTLDGITATVAELNLLDGVTATTAELNYVDGVTSNIQTQLNALQASDADLTAIAALSNADGNFIVGDGTTWIVESGATARTSLGLAIGSNVQAWDAQLDDVAGLTPTDGNFIVGDGTNFVAESGSTARTSLGLGTIATAATGDYAATANNLSDLASASTALTNLGLTATASELNYTDGVTSNIQTQLDGKATEDTALALSIALG